MKELNTSRQRFNKMSDEVKVLIDKGDYEQARELMSTADRYYQKVQNGLDDLILERNYGEKK